MQSTKQCLAASILDTIGDTPLVALDRLSRGLNGRVLAKIEFFNPGFSIKDRIALQIIEDAERGGLLKPGGRVVELTSGNTGTGLALVCAVKGYRFIAVMSEGNSRERARMMRALGAEVVLVPQVGGSRPGQVSGEDLAEVDRVTSQLAKKLKAFRADQFNNLSNARAHELTTGQEIWEQTGGKVDAFVSTLGTGGTFAGVTAALKKRNPRIKCYAVEPAGAAYLAKGKVTDPNHKIQGTGYAMPLPLVKREWVDGLVTVTDREAIRTARLLAKKEGIFAGFSSGANVAVALRLARRAKHGAVIVTTINDSGLKYLSTDLFPER
ncbi:MAG: cysteine synthase family protein [Chloroflexi bacterium]|nr:cysteine synthase family protein [Chloroflexota bacterium]